MEEKDEKLKKYPFPPFRMDKRKEIDDSSSPIKVCEIADSLVRLFGHKHGYSPEKIFKELERRKFLTSNKQPICNLDSTLYSLCTHSRCYGYCYMADDYINKRKKDRQVRKRLSLQSESVKIVDKRVSEPFIDYSKQMSDERWKAFRNFVFTVRGRKCELCGSGKSLQVHHPKYIMGLKAWEYTCNQVIVVCRCCHENIHSIPQRNK